LTRSPSHTDDHHAAELESRLQQDNDVSDVMGLLQRPQLPHTEDADDESGKGSDSSAAAVVAVTGGTKDTVGSHDAGSSDALAAVSELTARGDSGGTVAAGVTDSDRCHSAFTCDSDKLDMAESTSCTEADGGKLVTEFDEAFITSSDSSDPIQSDGFHASCTASAVIDTAPSTATFPTCADRPNSVNSVESVHDVGVDSSEKHQPADTSEGTGETAGDACRASVDADPAVWSPEESTSYTLSSLVSQLKSAVSSALAGCSYSDSDLLES